MKKMTGLSNKLYPKKLFLLAAFLIIFLCFPKVARAATYYVATNGNDSNPGTEVQPFRTVQRGINATNNGDMVFIKSGTYNLSGFSKSISYSLSLIGENKNTTILENGGTLTFHNSLTVRNLHFRNYSSTVFHPLAAGSSETIDGIYFDNCIFDNVPTAIGERDCSGEVINVDITNCKFLNIVDDWSAYAVMFYRGKLDNINIVNNTFENIKTTNPTKNAMAILIGSNENRSITSNITIANNYIEGITGGVGGDTDNYEAHGILAYGSYIKVTGNTIRNVNYSDDHEAIYLKASDSKITNNVVHNGGSRGSGGGDISIKGDGNVRNVVSGNRVTGDYAGTGIYTKGEVTIENNYVRKPAGGVAGVYAYNAIGRPIIVTNNHIETKDLGILIYRADQGEISYNLIISYAGRFIRYSGASGFNEIGNDECQTNCSGRIPPNPTCQNLGYLCCSACQSGAHPGYDSTCGGGQRCCDVCTSGPPPSATPTPRLTPTPEPTPTPNPYNLNDDDVVNAQDVLVLLANYLSSLFLRADFNGDGQVNGIDFAQLVGQLW